MGDGKRKEALPTLLPGSRINDGLFLAEGIYVVNGAKRAAVYKTPVKEVFSLNNSGRNIIFGEVNNPDYLKQLQDLGILTDQPSSVSKVSQKDSASHKRIDFAWFELTPNCNEKCVHCYAECAPIVPATVKDKGRLKFSDWKHSIVATHDLGCTSGQFIGGEPFLYRGENRETVLDLAEFARKTGYETVEVFSNATLLIRAKIERIKALGLNMAVSLYSSVPEIHDQITKTPGSWAKTTENLKLLREYEIPTRVEVILMRENEVTIADTIKFVDTMGFGQIKPDVVRPNGRGSDNNCAPTSETQIKYGYILEPDFSVDQTGFLNAQTFNSCLAGKITVTENGDVLPCIFSRNQILGNILSSGLHSVVSGEPLQNIWRTSKDRILVCQDCEYRYACSDCRPLAFGANNSRDYLQAPFPRCTYNPYEGEWGNGFWRLNNIGQPVYDLSMAQEIETQRRTKILPGKN